MLNMDDTGFPSGFDMTSEMTQPFVQPANQRTAQKAAEHTAQQNALSADRPFQSLVAQDPAFLSPEAFMKMPVSLSPQRADLIITRLLLSMGFTPRNLGYYYLRDCLIAAVLDPNALLLLTKVLYPDIGKMHGTAGADVERTIRFSVHEWYKTQTPGTHYTGVAGRDVIVPDQMPSNYKIMRQLTEVITGKPVSRPNDKGPAQFLMPF